MLLVVLAHGRADRAAALRRRLDDRDVAQPGQRHVQRARDRRRRQREHVDLEAQRAEQLLLRDAEALLLVEDDEAEVLRDHVAREHAVRADQHLDLAVREVAERRLLLGACCGSARPSRREPGSRDSDCGRCSSAAPRGSSSARASASACRSRRRRTPRARRPPSCRSRRRRRRGGPSAAAPRDPASRPRSRAPGPASRGRGTPPRAAGASRCRGRTPRPAPAAAARRARAARRRARGRTCARGS